MCPYYRRENLNDELKEKLGTDTWTSCDRDKVGMDAADQIERDQKEMAELRAALEKATEMADALNKKCDMITKKLEQLSGAHSVVGDSKGGHAMNEPLTLQELVELNGQPVWMGEPFNQWTTISIDPKYIQGITPGMKIRKGAMNVNGERVEIPPVDFYRYPPKEETRKST